MRINLNYLLLCLCLATSAQAKEVRACLNSHCTKMDSAELEKAPTKNLPKKKAVETTKAKTPQKKKVIEATKAETLQEKISEKNVKETRALISQQLWRGLKYLVAILRSDTWRHLCARCHE